MVEDQGNPGAKGTQSLPEGAVLVELEYAAVNGRQIVYDVLKSVLADKGVTLTPILFSRYCVDATPQDYVDALLSTLGKGRLSSENIVKDITEGTRLSLLDGNVTLKPGIKALLDAAGKQDLRCGVLTALDSETATALVSNLGLDPAVTPIQTFTPGTDETSASANPWSRLAKRAQVPRLRCVAVTTSLDTCKSAIAAGINTVVVTDSFTSFQDFGGADLVVDNLDNDVVEGTLSLLDER